jgi:hypothetical protein
LLIVLAVGAKLYYYVLQCYAAIPKCIVRASKLRLSLQFFCSTLCLFMIQQIARNAAIAAENMCLLNAMTRILSSPSDVAKHYDDAHKKARSINCVMRRRELERISIANKHILRGILSTKPVYDVKALKRDYDDNVATMNRLRNVKDTKRITKDMSVQSVSKSSTVHRQVPLTAAVVIQHNNEKLQQDSNDSSNELAATACSEYGGSEFEQDKKLQPNEHNAAVDSDANEYSTNDFVQVVQSEGAEHNTALL